MAKKNDKIHKKAFVELFESKIHKNSVAKIEFEKSHKSKLTSEYGSGWISFYNEPDAERNAFIYGREDTCYMRTVEFNSKYYLEFNSLSVEITMTDFLRLQKMYMKKLNVYNKLVEVNRIDKDMTLLQKAFAEKTQIETRKTIIEKAPKIITS